MPNKNFDTVIGRVKEAVGALTGNKGLKHDGRVDQATVSQAIKALGVDPEKPVPWKV